MGQYPKYFVRLSLAIGLIWLSLVACASPQKSGQSAPVTQPSASQTDEHRLKAWRDDISNLVIELPKRHKNAFFKTSRQDFEQAAAALQEKLPSLTDADIVIGMARLVAMLGDGHTMLQVSLNDWRLRRLPLGIGWFSDGLFIAQAPAQNRDLLGTQLVRIGNMPIDEAIKRIATVFAAENESSLKNLTPNWLIVAEALHAVDVIDDMEHVVFTVRDSQGREQTVELTPLPPNTAIPSAFLPDPQTTPVPISRQKRPQYNWFEFLPEHNALYCRYDTCSDQKDHTVKQFADEILKFVDERAPEKVIVDLRRNGGGNSGLAAPLINGLASRKSIDQKGRLFVLIGRGTFSSALMNADEFREKTHALLYGEPTGGKPNSYGEVRTFTLPNSKMTVQYSTKYWHLDKQADPPALAPDVLIELSSADYFAGRDPVLDAVLAAKPE